MDRYWSVYDSHLNADIYNFGGLEWVVDGERGRYSYPGTFPECLVKRMYMEGVSKVPLGYCDGCVGSSDKMNCQKIVKGEQK